MTKKALITVACGRTRHQPEFSLKWRRNFLCQTTKIVSFIIWISSQAKQDEFLSGRPQFPNWKSSFRIQSKLLDQQPGTTGGSSFKTPKGNSAKNIWNIRRTPWTLRTLIMKSPKPENTETLSTNQHKGNLCKQMNHIIPTICFICFHHWENPRHEAVEIPRASVAATPGRLKKRFWEVKRFDSSMISWIKSKDFWTIIFVMFSLTPHVMFTVHTYSGLGKRNFFCVY